MADRQLRVTLIGDTRNLDRALGRTETRLKRFGRTTGGIASAGGLGGGGLLSGRGILAGGALTAGALGVRSFINASRDAEVILGQTSVAVEQAGLSWEKNAARIDAAATRISKSSSFDDEEVLQSFQVFVRGQKDVGKSIKLSSLAADVARARYTDLASATSLVNKAALGQIGALRRAGIAIDANATATEALTKLQQAFGGASEKYSKSAAGSADRLRVAWENLGEQAGGPLSSALANLTNHLTSVFDHTKAAKAELADFDNKDFRLKFQNAFGIKELNDTLQALAPQIKAAREDFLKAIQPIPLTLKPATGARSTGPIAFGQPGFKPTNRGSQLTREQSLLLQQDKASISPQLSDDLKVAEALVKLYKGLAAGKKGEELFKAQQDLIGAQSQVASLNEQIAAGAREVTTAASEAAARAKTARERAVDALKAQAAAFKEEAESIKSAVLDAFDSKTSRIDNARALTDAKEALRVARQEGGPEGIKLAGRDLVDAQRAIQRQQLENTAFKVTGGPAGPVNTLQVGNITINVNGSGDPDAVAKKVIAAINRRSKQNASQSSGHRMGHHVVLG